jgi:hypothetical protein
MAKNKDGKLPAILFYPGDWWRDPGVRMLNLEERGFWFQLLLVMHECDRRGYLEVNGSPMKSREIGKIMGITRAKTEKILAKILSFGVLSREQENGVFFSRRMVKDESIRQGNIHNGSLGGNPSLTGKPVNPPDKPGVDDSDNQEDKRKTTPSSSSSTSTSTSVITTPTPSEKIEHQPSDQTALPGAASSTLGSGGDSQVSKSAKKPRKTRTPAEPIMIPDNLASHPDFDAAWDRWQKHRSELRKPMTPTSRNMLLGKLSKFGPVKAIVEIDRAITSGWTGIHEDTGQGSTTSKKPHDTRPACITDYDPAMFNQGLRGE